MDVAAALLVVDHAAHGELVGNDRQVDRRVEIAARLTVCRRCVASVHHCFSHIELRLVCDVTHNTRLGARSEHGALRAFQYLNALEIGGVDVKIAAGKLRGLIIEVHRDARESTETTRRLYPPYGRRQAAYVDIALTGAHSVRGNTGQIAYEVIKSRGVQPSKCVPS